MPPKFEKKVLPIRYCDRDLLTEQLNKVLGDGNWGDVEVSLAGTVY